MKKIKGLLLFGILTLLGIGSSFSQFYDLDDPNGSQLILPHIYTNQGYLYVDYLYGESVYRSASFTWDRFLSANAHIPVNACLNSSSQIVGFSSNSIAFGNNTSCSSSVTLWNPSSSSAVFFPYIYMSSSADISPYSIRAIGTISSYIYFDNTTFYTNYGNIVDVPDGYSRKNLFLNNIGNYGIVSTDSSGNYLLTSIGQDSFNVSDLGNGSYNFDLDVYSGFLILHFNDYSSSYYTGNSTIVLSIGSGEVFYNLYTGFYNGIQEINYYGIYPYKIGLLAYNGDTGIAYSHFVSDVLNQGHIILTAGSVQGGIFFTAYSYSQPYASSDLNRVWVTKTTSTLFTFQDDDSVPTFIIPSGGGNGNQSTFSGNVSLNNCVDTQVCYDTTGDNGEVLHICTTKCIDTGSIVSGSYIGSDGTIYYVDSSYNVGNISNPDGTIYDTGFLDEDGMLSIDYYSGLFNGNGFKFGVCPYPASDYLNFATKVKLGNFYPFMPLNCFISAFQQGVKVHYFDDSGLFPDNHSQLMAGDSHYHKTLFRFFDVLLSIGILLLLSALLRIIKK